MTSDQPSLFDDQPEPTAERELQSAEALLSLTMLPGVGNARAVKIAQQFDSWDDFLGAPPDLVHRLAGVKIEYPHRPTPPEAPSGVRLVGRFDSAYPVALRSIPNSPAVIWLRGSLPDPWPRLAVVGSRDASVWALETSRAIASAASKEGLSVVSGLAFGIDIAAHRGALDAGGQTVAVLGSGVDVPSPKQHREDVELILASGGALVSEVPPGTPVSARALVARNRLQTGLSSATIVVECGGKSGTMTTARFAVEQGRQLLVPISTMPPSDSDAGSRSLLDSGVVHRRESVRAVPFETPEHLLRLLESTGAPTGSDIPLRD